MFRVRACLEYELDEGDFDAFCEALLEKEVVEEEYMMMGELP